MGRRFFQRLRGMFAIAIWTESQQRLVIARDRVGIKPLYVAHRGEDLYFGSELKAILAHPEIEREISLPALDCYLALNYIPAPWTMIDGITKLMPGTWLEWRDGKVRTDSYWKLPAPHAEKMSMEAATEELDSLLQQSVKEHLLSDVPLSVWLSGGLDSSTILHYASRASSAQVNTFSISFRGRSFDESSYIATMVEKYGTNHEELDLNPDRPGSGRRDPGVRVLLRRAQCRCRRAAAVVPGEVEPAENGSRTQRRGRRRVVRRISDVSRQPCGAESADGAEASPSTGQALMQLWPVPTTRLLWSTRSSECSPAA